MAVIKVKDLAYGRLRAPDLDAMEEFLTHFGMLRAERTPHALYMRGTDAPHHIHVTEKGDPGFVGFAYHAASEEDLHRLAKVPGASAVESVDEILAHARRAVAVLGADRVLLTAGLRLRHLRRQPGRVGRGRGGEAFADRDRRSRSEARSSIYGSSVTAHAQIT